MQEPGDKRPDADEPQAGLHVDEDWKKSVADEKRKLKEQDEQTHRQQQEAEFEEPTEFPEPSIQIFLAGLYTQTLVALGTIQNPLTGKQKTNAAEAAYLIDTIDMLREKTQGNLTPEEDAYMDHILYDLRMRYVTATGGSDQAPQEAAGIDEG